MFGYLFILMSYVYREPALPRYLYYIYPFFVMAIASTLFLVYDKLLKKEWGIKDEYIKNIPLSRFGQPKEIADAVAFLLSDHSSYITGEILKVNGGLYV